MLYVIMKSNTKTGNDVKHAEYSSKEQAEAQLEKMNGKSKGKKRAYLLYRPEGIGVGYKIYSSNGEFYGIISHETDYFYYVSKKEDTLLEDCVFFVKDNFLSYFDRGYFMPVDKDKSPN